MSKTHAILIASYNNRKAHNVFEKSEVAEVLEGDAKEIFNIFSAWYKKNDTITCIEYKSLCTYFDLRFTDMEAEKKAKFKTYFKGISEQEYNQTTLDILIEQIVTEKYLKTVAEVLLAHNAGVEIEAMYDIEKTCRNYKDAMQGVGVAPWISDSLSDILDQQEQDGISWRLQCLADHMQPMPPGTFGIVAARPDKGKTTFLASEVIELARQLPPDKNLIWLNNEGAGSKIIPRLYQSALNVTGSELKARVKNGTYQKDFIEIVGREDKIRVIDIHNKTAGQVERLLLDMKAGVVVFDMIDNIKFPSISASKTDSLESMYQWARDLMVEINAVGIATSQISNEGANEMFPDYSHLKDSKTGKQGACDFIVLIGHYRDPGLDHKRGISIPKNKLPVEGKVKDPRAEVLFQPSIARFLDQEVQDVPSA